VFQTFDIDECMCLHKLAIHYAVVRNSHFLEVIILVADILGDSTEMLITVSVALEASECCALSSGERWFWQVWQHKLGKAYKMQHLQHFLTWSQ
jgi:hypothetical protein